MGQHYTHHIWTDGAEQRAFGARFFGGTVMGEIDVIRNALVLGNGIERVLEGETRNYWGGVVKGPKRQRYTFHLKCYPFYVGDIHSDTDHAQTQFWEHYDSFMEVFQKRWVMMYLGSAPDPGGGATDRMQRFFKNFGAPGGFRDASSYPTTFVELVEASYESDYDNGWDRVDLTLQKTHLIEEPTNELVALFPHYYKGTI